MKKTFLLVLVTGVLSLLPWGVGAQTPLDVKVVTLRNGLTVWLNEDHARPKIYGAVVVKVGAKDCPNTGMAHYFEHLLFKGTDKIGTTDYAREKPWLDSIEAAYDRLSMARDEQERRRIGQHINDLSIQAAKYVIPNEFENLITTYGGTGLNAYTSFDETVYHNAFSPQYLAQWCELNAERLVSPVFRLFQGELETVYEEKNMYQDQLGMQAVEAAQQYAFAGTPYAWSIIGSTDSLKRPSISALRRFYEQYYVAGNMAVILCGDFKADSVAALLERTFGRIRRGEAPQTTPSQLRSFRGDRGLKVKLPVPLVKASGYGFKAPTEHSGDAAAFRVMAAMLSNDNNTGLLDSLTTTGKVMAALARGWHFKDFSVYGYGAVPKLPFGSRRAAERMCRQQIDRLRTGRFSPAAIEAEKRMLGRDLQMQLEDAARRSEMMVNAFSHGLSWQEVLDESRRVAAVTRDDVMRVARTYLNDDSLHIVKTFGRYPKDRVAQPGYKPVRPVHAGERSAYARWLAEMPRADQQPRLVDLRHDADHRQLRPLVHLYTTPNPMNGVGRLQLFYRVGADSHARLKVLAAYLSKAGTRQRSRQQLGRALQKDGFSLDVSAQRGSLVVTLTGMDDGMEQALPLLNELLTSAAADSRVRRDMLRALRLEERTWLKDYANIATAVYGMAVYGQRSDYLDRYAARDLRRVTADSMVAWFRDVQRSQLDVVYSGRHSTDDMARLVSRHVPIDCVERPWHAAPRPVREVTRPVVYVYDAPRARQTVVGTYRQVSAQTGVAGRAVCSLWANYFGGGMSSVLFQDIREFRAYAYSARGTLLMPDFNTGRQLAGGYVTRLSTQADKAMLALGVLDSLLDDMPVRPSHVEAARQEMVNDINNGYPSFRDLGAFVATHRLLGYDDDPGRAMLGVLPHLRIDDVVRFHRQEMQGRPRAIIIVGNRKQLDMKRLHAMGEVVMLRRNDIFRR